MPPTYTASGYGSNVIAHTAQHARFVDETIRALHDAGARLQAYFELVEPFPAIRVIVTPERQEFDRCVRDVLGLDWETPSDPHLIAAPQRTDLIVLSPLAKTKESSNDGGRSACRMSA